MGKLVSGVSLRAEEGGKKKEKKVHSAAAAALDALLV